MALGRTDLGKPSPAQVTLDALEEVSGHSCLDLTELGNQSVSQ